MILGIIIHYLKNREDREVVRVVARGNIRIREVIKEVVGIKDSGSRAINMIIEATTIVTGTRAYVCGLLCRVYSIFIAI